MNRPRTMSYTQRTLERCRKMGLSAGIVERRVVTPHGERPFVTRDFFGAIDVVAADPAGGQILGIQSTSFKQLRKHETAYLEEGRPDLAAWVASGGRFEVWGWRKIGAWWHVRRDEFVLTGHGWEIHLRDDGRGGASPRQGGQEAPGRRAMARQRWRRPGQWLEPSVRGVGGGERGAGR